MRKLKTAIEFEMEEKAKHHRLLSHINALLSTISGQEFIKYLFEQFSPLANIPPFCKSEELIERAAFNRTGVAIYNIISEANPDMAGVILSKIRKEGLNHETTELSQDESGDGYEY